MILAFETSTQVCSVSFQGAKGEIHEKRIMGRSVHSEHLFLFTKALMEEHGFKISDLDAVIVSNGPGSYTGLRIAASAIKGLLFAADVPLYAANTLASFAMEPESKPTQTIHAIIDARRTHVYNQSFVLDGKLRAVSEAAVVDIAEFQKKVSEGDIIIGTGLNRLEEENLKSVSTFDIDHVTANSLIKLFSLLNSEEFCTRTSVEELDPYYLTSNQVNNSSG